MTDRPVQIEVTQEMIDAGVSALLSSSLAAAFFDGVEDPAELVASVIRASLELVDPC